MEHLCVGSYVRTITSCAIPAERKFDPFCEKIMLSLCPAGATAFSYTSVDGYEVTYSFSNFSKIHSSSQNLPTEVMQMALTKDARAIERYFINVIIPAMDEARKKNAVLALKHIILEDQTIVDTTQLGSISCLTKKELRNKSNFILPEFLTDIFIYAVAKTDNLIEADFTKSIHKNYYALFDNIVDTITLNDVERTEGPSIPPTAKAEENFGYQKLTENDKRLLKRFHMDFDDRMKKCIASDQPDTWFLGGISGEMDNLYNRWKSRIADFEDINLQSDVLRAIACLRRFCDILDPDSNPIPGASVRKLRMELRNCYVKLHPDDYAGIFPYDAFIDDWNDGE